MIAHLGMAKMARMDCGDCGWDMLGWMTWTPGMIWTTVQRFPLFAMLSSRASVGVSEDHGSAALAKVEMPTGRMGKLMATGDRTSCIFIHILVACCFLLGCGHVCEVSVTGC